MVAIFATTGCTLETQVASSLKGQRSRNESARSFLESNVLKNLKVGDTVEQAKEALKQAGLEPHEERFDSRITSFLRTGPGSGFNIALDIDSERRVVKIEAKEQLTGP